MNIRKIGKEKEMNTEQLTQMVEGFNEMAKAINTGDLKVEDLKEIMNDLDKQIDVGMEMIVKIMNNEEVEGLNNIQKIAIKTQIENEVLNFDAKKQKLAIVTLLQVSQATDKEIGEDVILPFMSGLLDKMLPTIESLHKDSGKAIRKGIKKFNKLNTDSV
jgi:hypothetical protein